MSKKKQKQHLGSMVIGHGHVIMLGNVPEAIDDTQLLNLSKNLFSWNGLNKESVESYGFWSEIDYNTYYPDLKLEDLKPKEDEFINPMFRLLSATIVSKNYNPTDFSTPGVLKNSMPLLLGQTVNCDHETNIGNAIGAVSKVVWQEAYKDEKTGFMIPAGINGVLKIDGKANPRIARGILMNPPSIHSNSVTVQFKWEKSHPDMEDREFYEKLGTYDAKGNMVRRMVTEIVRYMETSLVSHGADAFAQKIGEDGKIINPTYAQRTWGSYKEYEDDKSKQYFFYDIKQDTDYYQEKENDTPSTHNINPEISQNSNNEEMNQELREFLDKLFGKDMLILGEGKEASVEEAITCLTAVLTEKATLSEQVQNLTTEKTQLAEKVQNLEAEKLALQADANLGKSYITKLRETAVANYKKMQGDKFDEKDPILVMLNAETTGAATLEALNGQYETRLNEQFPMKCNHCGSKDVSRASSIEQNGEKNNGDQEELSEVRETSAVMSELIAKKNRYNRDEEEGK